MPLHRKARLVWYWFSVRAKDRKCTPVPSRGRRHLAHGAPPSAPLPAHRVRAPGPASWAGEGAFYQIFVDRFDKSLDGIPKLRKGSLHTDWDDTPVYVRACKDGSVKRWTFFGETSTALPGSSHTSGSWGLTPSTSILSSDPQQPQVRYFRLQPHRRRIRRRRGTREALLEGSRMGHQNCPRRRVQPYRQRQRPISTKGSYGCKGAFQSRIPLFQLVPLQGLP